MTIRKRNKAYQADVTTKSGERIRRSFDRRKDAKAFIEGIMGTQSPNAQPVAQGGKPFATSRNQSSNRPRAAKTGTASLPAKPSSRKRVL